MSQPIDFVIPWVDGNDEDWLRDKRHYDNQQLSAYAKHWSNSEERYRDWNLLKYWFRGCEKYAPWVHKIYFITWGHIPDWLNIKHPKLCIVKHEDYIPSQYLPTFSSHCIELNVHRISGLSENFVFFNDDTFLTAPVQETDFFMKDKPRDCAVLLPIQLTQNGIRAEINDLYVINHMFEKRKIIRKNPRLWLSGSYGRLLLRTLLLLPFRYFPGFYISHLPCAYKKQTLVDVWNAVPEVLDETCRHRFRSTTDVNQWLFEYWQFASGNFLPRTAKIGHFYEGANVLDEMCSDIAKQKYKMVCCNDSPEINNFEDAKNRVVCAFEKILSQTSEFENTRGMNNSS